MCRRYKLDPLSASLLVRRGVQTGEDLFYFLEDDLLYMHNPFLFRQMEDAVERISVAIEEEEKVLIVGDRDVDGVVSTALLYEYLAGKGLECETFVPGGNDLYGLSSSLIEDFCKRDGSLVICVDCGSTDIEEIAYGNSKGMDFIVLDHHTVQPDRIPDAILINPKTPEERYPFDGLAACGVVSRFIWALCLVDAGVYNRSFCLINVSRSDQGILLEACRIRNFVIGSRVSVDTSRQSDRVSDWVDFVSSDVLLAFDVSASLVLLREVFGTNIDIHIADLKEEMIKVFPALAGKSREQIVSGSRQSRFMECEESFLDILARLYLTVSVKKNESVWQPWIKGLDLVALGTLADLMPLFNENRILIRKGLEILNRSDRVSLQELIISLGLTGRPIDSVTASWQIIPVLNAAGRMGEAEKALKLLLAKERKETVSFVNELLDLNRKRRDLGEELWQKMKREINAHDGENVPLIVFDGDDIPRGITGILASRALQTYYKPALVVSLEGKSASGSIRCERSFPVLKLLKKHQKLLDDYGGHDCAAGFSLNKNNWEEFRQVFIDDAGKTDVQLDSPHFLSIDAELPEGYLSPDLWDLNDKWGPFGESFPQFIFMIKKARIEKAEMIGRPADHLKLLLAHGKFKFPALFWRAADRYGSDFSLNDKVDVAFQLSRSYYQNRETIQLTVKDIKKT